MKPAIKQFPDNIPAENRTLANQIRKFILKADLIIKEVMKWGNLTFVHGKQNPAFIHTSKHC